MSPTDSLLEQLPAPAVVHQQMGRLYRQLALLRRLLRLSQAARDERTPQPTDRQEVRT
ncbi:MAG TPA: hypothetical protein VKA46_13975 [Gemmataceae bacterium]|nr:hypothetical protein [Gemmataceae bacterium]